MLLRHRGQDIIASRDPTQDPWFWSLAEEQDRKEFWRVVAEQGCMVLQSFNAAVIGLLYTRGYPVVVYDAVLANAIMRKSWLASKPVHNEELLAKQAESLSKWTEHDLGAQAPAWFSVHLLDTKR